MNKDLIVGHSGFTPCSNDYNFQPTIKLDSAGVIIDLSKVHKDTKFKFGLNTYTLAELKSILTEYDDDIK